MKKSDLVAVLGSQRALAALLDITPSAVSQWPEDLPELRIYQVRDKVPDIDQRIATLTKERAA
jgi:predicted transcriptional regulator